MAKVLSMKAVLVSTTVLSTAVMLKLSLPFLMDFALSVSVSVSDRPTIRTSLISWLTPPYLYLVFNFILLSIFATSRLQFKADHDPTTPVKVVLPDIRDVHDTHLPYDGMLLRNEAPEELTTRPQFAVSEPDPSPPEFTDDADIKTVTEAYEEMEIIKNSGNKSIISKSSFSQQSNCRNQLDFQLPMAIEKPAASARFSHRKSVKASPEVVKTLRVSKPKRQDTLESTWKAITEGRSMPLTRHLRKSDTWETHGHGRQQRNSQSQDQEESLDQHYERMTKSETFTVNRGGGVNKPPTGPGTGTGKLRKDPSIGQEELNKRVEAFIRKFNEDMRLQRQESLNQYMEMINRGAH